jgi:DNA ligase-1
MFFKNLASYLNKIELEDSRNIKTEILSDLFDNLDVKEVRNTMYLLDGRVAPRYQELEYNFSTKMMKRALSKLDEDSDVENLYKDLGDLGDVAKELINDKTHKVISINDIYDQLLKIALVSGKGSQEEKIRLIVKLLKGIDSLSSKYVVRMIIGRMRLGINYRTILDAMSWFRRDDKSLRDLLDRAYGVRTDLGEIGILVKKGQIDKLREFHIETGLPVAAKLVEREKKEEKILERFGGECIIQPKLDGLRAQIHYNKNGLKKAFEIRTDQNIIDNLNRNEIAIYSRNMNEMTDMYPDVVQSAPSLGLDSFVLDSEIIGYDEETGDYFPFQKTITRKRKYDVNETLKNIPVKVIVFDILYINSNDITQRPLNKRLKILEDKINENDIFKISEYYNIKDVDSLEIKFTEFTQRNLEGLIAKGIDTAYDPGTRNYDWIKMKASAKDGHVDTIDAVVLGYYYGRGARASLGIGAILVGAYNKESGKYQSLAKIGTGMTEEDFVNIKDDLDDIKIPKPSPLYVVNKELYPDVWVEPKIVSEIDYDEISKSQNHKVGEGRLRDYSLSLRFPRMKIFKRDKEVGQSTTVSEIIKMYNLQKSN